MNAVLNGIVMDEDGYWNDDQKKEALQERLIVEGTTGFLMHDALRQVRAPGQFKLRRLMPSILLCAVPGLGGATSGQCLSLC
jgi:hypothetical protein